MCYHSNQVSTSRYFEIHFTFSNILSKHRRNHKAVCGWLGRAMVLGSSQGWGILLLWHMVGQGPVVLVAGAGWVGCFLCVFFIASILSSFSNASSVGRRLDILKYCGLSHYNPGVVSVTTGVVSTAKYWLITKQH